MIDFLGMFAIAWALAMIIIIVSYFILEYVKGKKRMIKFAVYKIDVEIRRYTAKFPSREELVDIAKALLLTRIKVPIGNRHCLTGEMDYTDAREMAKFMARGSELYLTYSISDKFILTGTMYVVCVAKELINGKMQAIAVKDIYYKKGEGIDDYQIRLY